MIFTLFTHKPSAKKIGNGILSVAENGSAIFFEGEARYYDKALAKMQRIKIEFANPYGIMLSGMEPNGFDKRGIEIFQYQKWWLLFNKKDEK